ncbi:yeats family-domain-containing protein [Pyronema omphalodes]|nr:yeats family-domain-containing protein [Pyronema omphalodes]
MTEISRKIKLVTQQSILEDVPPAHEGFPMRAWSIRVFILGPNGEELPATVFDKVIYKLHPTFPNPTRVLKKPPFLIEEKGWGEFDMNLVLHAIDKGGDHNIQHDLNFQKNKYESIHTITFTNPRPNLLKQLALSGPIPGAEATPEENGVARKDKRKNDGEERSKKKSRSEKSGSVTFDMEKLADGLQKLEEEDLLKVVQMVHDHKTSETYVKNDVEQGEFHVDLYTLPDHLVKMLWKFVNDAGVVG